MALAGLVLGTQVEVDSLGLYWFFSGVRTIQMSHEILDECELIGYWGIHYCLLNFLSFPFSLLSFFLPSFLFPSVFHGLELYICGSTKLIGFHPLGCLWAQPHHHMCQCSVCSWSLPGLALLGNLWNYWIIVIGLKANSGSLCSFYFIVASSIGSIKLTK